MFIECNTFSVLNKTHMPAFKFLYLLLWENVLQMHQGDAVLDIVDFQDDSGEHYSVYISGSLLGAMGK